MVIARTNNKLILKVFGDVSDYLDGVNEHNSPAVYLDWNLK